MTATETADTVTTQPSRFASIQPWISLLVRLGLAAVWLAAGLLKVGSPQQAVMAVEAYELPLPSTVVSLIGLGLPWFEVALGLLLIAGLLTRPTAIVSAVVLVVFMIGVASAWARGLAIDCGCFGGGGAIAPEDTQYVSELLRDLGFLALAAWLIVFPRSKFSLDRFAADDEEIE